MRLITVEVFVIKEAATDLVLRRDPEALRKLRTVENYAKGWGQSARCLLCDARVPTLPKRFAVMKLGDDDETPACSAICNRCGTAAHVALVSAATRAFAAGLPTAGSA
jgi:hypothetical protein